VRRSLNALLILGILLVVLAVLRFVVPKSVDEPQTLRQPEAGVSAPVATGPKGYLFTADWFSRAQPLWRSILSDRAGRPALHYLEIGVFEGRSLVWMLDNVLTAPSARATVIDPFFDADVEARFDNNLERSGHPGKVTVKKGLSQVELRRLPLDSFDVIYIDGSHTADDVLADAVLSWDLLRDGGLLIFDDYLSKGSATTPESRPLPPQLRPRLAIDAFISTYLHRLEMVHRGYQLVLRKVAHPAPPSGTARPSASTCLSGASDSSTSRRPESRSCSRQRRPI
jgi:predicted O-methyltransferase YrrM